MKLTLRELHRLPAEALVPFVVAARTCPNFGAHHPVLSKSGDTYTCDHCKEEWPRESLHHLLALSA